MNSFEMNKIIGALLGTVFIVFSVSLISDAMFASPSPETPGYAIEAAEPEAGGAAAEGPTEEPIAVRMQTADAAKGEALFKRCATCHTDDSGGANKIGPNLWSIINRPVAGHEGFSYSAPMKEFAEGGSVVWDYEHLDHFIAAPKALVKGTAMSFAGLKNPEDRANLIAYLRTTADSEAPLPEVPAEGAAEGSADSGANAEGANEAAPAGEAAPAEPTESGTAGQTPADTQAAPQDPAVETPDGGSPEANPSATEQPEGEAAPAEQEDDADAPAGEETPPAQGGDTAQ